MEEAPQRGIETGEETEGEEVVYAADTPALAASRALHTLVVLEKSTHWERPSALFVAGRSGIVLDAMVLLQCNLRLLFL